MIEESKFNMAVFKTLCGEIIDTLDSRKGLEMAFRHADLPEYGPTWICQLLKKDTSVKINGNPTWLQAQIVWILHMKKIFVNVQDGDMWGLEDPKLHKKMSKVLKTKWNRQPHKPDIRGRNRARR